LTSLAVNATVRYGRALALNAVSLTFPAGKISAVVGPNGAGKTSLLRAIYGSVPSTGSIRLGSTQLGGKSAIDRARAGIAIVPQGRQIFPHLTVAENLELMARLVSGRSFNLAAVYARFPILQERAKQLAGNLSGGEQQMLVIARALLQRPSVLLLDEVATGLAPRVVASMLSIASEIAEGGGIVVVAEPSTAVLRGRVDGGHVLVRGEVVGTAQSWEGLDGLYRHWIGIGVKNKEVN
jgi:branched-chain amino acid transport system ATP-binding protein